MYVRSRFAADDGIIADGLEPSITTPRLAPTLMIMVRDQQNCLSRSANIDRWKNTFSNTLAHGRLGSDDCLSSLNRDEEEPNRSRARDDSRCRRSKLYLTARPLPYLARYALKRNCTLRVPTATHHRAGALLKVR